jgi:hypothetical protein
MVRNVSRCLGIEDEFADFGCRQLPWSTANEDLVELFETTGQVELAEILFDGTRSKGAGVVQFAQVAEAETAIGTLPLRTCPSRLMRNAGMQLSFSNTCMEGDPLMYDSMTAGTHSPRQRPRAGRRYQCNQMACKWCTCLVTSSMHQFGSLVLIYLIVRACL